MAVVHAVAQTVLTVVESGHPTSSSLLDPIVIALLVGVSGLWGAVDGWLRSPNRGLAWFFAGLIGGPLAGLLAVALKAIFVDQTGVWALTEALTGGAAFVALLIMVPAAIGLGVGGRMEPPNRDRGATRATIKPSPTPRS
jgi:hypothetical protein